MACLDVALAFSLIVSCVMRSLEVQLKGHDRWGMWIV